MIDSFGVAIRMVSLLLEYINFWRKKASPTPRKKIGNGFGSGNVPSEFDFLYGFAFMGNIWWIRKELVGVSLDPLTVSVAMVGRKMISMFSVIAMKWRSFGGCTSQAIWNTVFFKSTKDEWFKLNCKNPKFKSKIWPDVSWPSIFLASIWLLWKARNAFVFDKKRRWWLTLP